MIGQPNWFKTRKYGGWGVTPATKEGWIYLVVMILPLILLQRIPGAKAVWVAIFLLDIVDIMIRMKKDEREFAHEAVAERNVAWFLIAALMAEFLYKTISTNVNGVVQIDWYLIAPILGATVVKALTHLYLRDK